MLTKNTKRLCKRDVNVLTHSFICWSNSVYYPIGRNFIFRFTFCIYFNYIYLSLACELYLYSIFLFDVVRRCLCVNVAVVGSITARVLEDKVQHSEHVMFRKLGVAWGTDGVNIRFPLSFTMIGLNQFFFFLIMNIFSLMCF